MGVSVILISILQMTVMMYIIVNNSKMFYLEWKSIKVKMWSSSCT